VTRRQSYQQGHVSKPIPTRSGAVFKIRYRVKSADGKWNQKAETLYGLSGKKAARAVLEERIRGACFAKPEGSNLNLRAFVDAWWKPYLQRKGVKPSTRRNYDSILELHILPVFGELRIDEVVPLHVERFIQTKVESGLSGKTVRNLLLVLQGIMSLALDNDLIDRSPIRNRHKPTVDKHEKPIWSPTQLLNILSGAPTGLRAFFDCVALTGTRLGEVLALKWKHVDLERRILRIEHSLWRGQLLSPKTTASTRDIPLGSALNETLRTHRENSLHRGPDDFVFCKKDGSALDPDVLRKDALYPILDRLGIPRKKGASGFHTFRHSAASIVNEQTGNLKLAQKFLGHSTIKMTADIYTHTSAEAERDAAIALERAIYGDLFPVVPNIENRNNFAALN
jgi:integrase